MVMNFFYFYNMFVNDSGFVDLSEMMFFVFLSIFVVGVNRDNVRVVIMIFLKLVIEVEIFVSRESWGCFNEDGFY